MLAQKALACAQRAVKADTFSSWSAQAMSAASMRLAAFFVRGAQARAVIDGGVAGRATEFCVMGSTMTPQGLHEGPRGRRSAPTPCMSASKTLASGSIGGETRL